LDSLSSFDGRIGKESRRWGYSLVMVEMRKEEE
jgi:hypothetical protein